MQRIYKDYTKNIGRINIIKRLKTTRQAVWLYMGPTKKAARKAYLRASEKESSRVRCWANHIQQRTDHIRNYLDRLMENLSILGDIPENKQQAIRTIQHHADNPPPCDMAFYNHMQQERNERLQRRKAGIYTIPDGKIE